MKDKKYIISKLFIKHAIPLLLLCVVMVLFFINVFNKTTVYASEQMAQVDCEISVVNADSTELICVDSKVVSVNENSLINFSDINVKLNKTSRLEFVYVISNLTSESCVFNLKFNKFKTENFKVEYYINQSNGELSSLDYCLSANQIVLIKVVVSVDDVSKNAVLDGNIEIMFTEAGKA